MQKGNTNTILLVIVIIIILVGGYWLANKDKNTAPAEENNGLEVNIGGTFPAGSGQEGGAAE